MRNLLAVAMTTLSLATGIHAQSQATQIRANQKKVRMKSSLFLKVDKRRDPNMGRVEIRMYWDNIRSSEIVVNEAGVPLDD